MIQVKEELSVNEIKAHWYCKGRDSVYRKNKSGCRCIIDDSDNIISVCGAHESWLAEALTNEKRMQET